MTNITSARRKGDDYQDILGLYYIGLWLQDRSLYDWIQYECQLVEGGYYLDDLVLGHADGGHSVFQIKHRQHPSEAPWTWDELLKQEPGAKGPKQSLIQKWHKSFKQLKERSPVKEAAFLTNGIPDGYFASFLTGEFVDIVHVYKSDEKLYERIASQIGSDSDTNEFFKNFRFRFNQPSVDEFDEQVQRFYVTELYATDLGYLNLFRIAKKEARKQKTVRITYEQVFKWCEFDSPQELNEDFHIPSDFQCFDQGVHRRLLKELSDTNGGFRLVIGKPGAGKSTYLSRLSSILSDRKQIVLRHHYHLEPGETDTFERVQRERVIEAIKAQCKKYPDAIGKLAGRNSGRMPVSDFLKQLANFGQETGKPTVLIIDGLDHATRYGDPAELTKFLFEVCVPIKGLWVVLGTQRVALSALPLPVSEAAPEQTWIEIPGLSEEAVFRVVLKNQHRLKLPKHEQQLESMLNAIYKTSAGNPLHLRYCLRQLKSIQGNSPVLAHHVRSLAPYGSGIEEYYARQWKSLSHFARTVLIALALIDYPLPGHVFRSLCSILAPKGTLLSGELKTFHHLLDDGGCLGSITTAFSAL
jgi:AAA ATPase domain